MKRETEFLYLELANTLRVQIFSGAIQPGQFLLSENEMCHKYQLSRTSVRKALQELLDEGLIVKIHGKGTMVAPEAGAAGGVKTLVIAAPFSGFAKKGLPILIREFHKRHPGVQVKVLPVPQQIESYYKSLVELGAEPDIGFVIDSDFQRLHLDLWSPLDDFTATGLFDDVPQPIVDVFSQDGRLLAAPITYSPIFLAYNKTLFDYYGIETPAHAWTQEQFVETAQALTRDIDGDGMPELYGFAVNSDLNRWSVMVMRQWSAFGADRHNPLRTHDMVQAFRFLQQLMYRHKVCPLYAVSNHYLTQELFEENRIAMILTSTFMMSGMAPHYGIAPLPRSFGDGSMLIVNGLQLFRESKNKELAKQFIRFCLEPESQRIMAQETGLLALSTAINREVFGEDRMEALAIPGSGIDRGKFLHQILPNLDMHGELDDTMIRFWTGIEKPETLVERLKTMELFGAAPPVVPT
ncbi:MAG: extracellular solute-binding protein [Paenibacillaceae bacterium]|uniref:extracellular solute-binding protein n=1 Tax=Paenibacillus cymbidii TaxID=1639034 RepID=UPI001080ED0C|nr:extracellular solute-binding protein [Paenibacillus cymbidii]MBO9604542.1 extracellular solute-binding protein [Paenibacillaceae bacterium]